jgi:hypothetical protein
LVQQAKIIRSGNKPKRPASKWQKYQLLIRVCAFSQMCNNHGVSLLLRTLVQAAFHRIEESRMLNGNVIGFPLRTGC